VSVGMSLVFNTHFYFSPTPRFQWGYSTLKSVEISSKISSTQGGGPALAAARKARLSRDAAGKKNRAAAVC
jgi:hypothetical protein